MLIIISFWLTLLAGCTTKELEEGDKDLVVTIGQLQPYGLELPPNFSSFETFRREQWFDGSYTIEYEFEAPEVLGLPYMHSMAEQHISKSEACTSYSAGKLGVSMGLMGADLEERDDLFEYGHRSSFGLIIVDGNPTGNYFGMCHEKTAFSVVIGGFYFDDGELWAELVDPALKAIDALN